MIEAYAMARHIMQIPCVLCCAGCESWLRGTIRRKRASEADGSSSNVVARFEPVARTCRSSSRSTRSSSVVLELHERDQLVVDETPVGVEQEALASRHPAPRFRPCVPRTTIVPRVMYSQAWSPTPSTTATAPEFRTANRSPAEPAT